MSCNTNESVGLILWNTSSVLFHLIRILTIQTDYSTSVAELFAFLVIAYFTLELC